MARASLSFSLSLSGIGSKKKNRRQFSKRRISVFVFLSLSVCVFMFLFLFYLTYVYKLLNIFIFHLTVVGIFYLFFYLFFFSLELLPHTLPSTGIVVPIVPESDSPLTHFSLLYCIRKQSWNRIAHSTTFISFILLPTFHYHTLLLYIFTISTVFIFHASVNILLHSGLSPLFPYLSL